MTKDYAKRKRPRKKTNTRTPRTNKSQKPLSPAIVFISGIVITLFLVFLWALLQKPELLKEAITPEESVINKEQTAKTKDDQPEKSTDTQSDDPEFTYHEALTNKKVEVEVTKPKTTDSNKTYIMQCGAFKSLPDAEKMKAELAFIGFQATVLTKGGWHRIRLGPYNSKRNAESDRHKLQDNNYQNCQIW
ncbi:SPOR domain-containing protein [Kangiella shandongensis]|uniref:SPOR domain-containing protein n=1 Tax=Kangiella shandongensis TaxID=2763258 RepID=UPI001CC1362E|nr:SPOR domain-containing protein [Kangiella shandongensis]